jgi:hypothetical protein
MGMVMTGRQTRVVGAGVAGACKWANEVNKRRRSTKRATHEVARPESLGPHVTWSNLPRPLVTWPESPGPCVTRPKLSGPLVVGTPEEPPVQSSEPAWSPYRLCIAWWVEPHLLGRTRVSPV